MPSSAAALPVTPDDLARLRRWASATQAPAALVQRAKLLLLAAEGVANSQIAERLGISRPTVIGWRKRYARQGLTGGLTDRPRPGRPRPCDASDVPRSWPPPSPRRPRRWG